MDIYSKTSASLGRKWFITSTELAFITLAALIMFGSLEPVVAGWFGWPVADHVVARRVVLIMFNLVTLARFSLMMFVFLKREVHVAELISVPVAFFLYLLVFPVLALPAQGPLDLWDGLGIALFLIGGALNTIGEAQRYAFKRDPMSKGRLFTGGLFAWSQHVNYLGDVLWVAGYAFVAHQIWGGLIPLVLLSFFVFSGIPALDKHLAEHYGEQYTDYAAKTKKLVPFVW
ncbi:MAG: DUF1295 domain-containing protein [Hyphomicrobiaceae bacterium]|nr:DUF1295 domain-containing protein [Hyphomicrobiaceae bacterium]MCC0025031.1 DUF1295 domain-containing protein [Hyphomicrobiaceae bacterium]